MCARVCVRVHASLTVQQVHSIFIQPISINLSVRWDLGTLILSPSKSIFFLSSMNFPKWRL